MTYLQYLYSNFAKVMQSLAKYFVSNMTKNDLKFDFPNMLNKSKTNNFGPGFFSYNRKFLSKSPKKLKGRVGQGWT